MQTKQRLLAAVLAASCVSAASLSVLAATEHWNDASARPTVTTATHLSDTTSWNTWAASWDDTLAFG